MSNPQADGSSSGHPSPESHVQPPEVASRRSSISEHSDAPISQAAIEHPSPSPDPEDETAYMNGGHDFAESSNSPDENNASDDGDFDMDEDVTNAQSDGAADAASISEDSTRSLKRK